MTTPGSDVVCDSPVSVPESQVQAKAFSVFPNPGNDRIRLDFPYDQSPLRVLVFDLTGIPVLNGWMGPNSEMDMSMLASGSYFLLLRDQKGQIHTVKWVKFEK